MLARQILRSGSLASLSLGKACLSPAVQAQKRFSVEVGLQRASQRASDASDLNHAARVLLKEVTHRVEQGIVANTDIPQKYKEFVITHVGSIDGVDEELPEGPVILTRTEAFAYADRDGHDLCYVRDTVQGQAECRLRYLKTWLRREVAAQSQKKRNKIEKKLKNTYLKQPEGVVTIPFRSTIEHLDLSHKVSDIVSALKEGKTVKIVLKLFATLDHSETFLEDVVQRAEVAAAKHELRIKVTERFSSKKGAGATINKA
eukprot:TRINITY_DN6146_c0_g1_i1.p1 TRINITY_DN6146_c0_g1~~TRINITY_DN6146_c0_g1_i1.p1  ORF type:complete len:259 (+),score=75.35 TRINITY_DN6146_c0_g1_i1:329-1105(+)